MGAGDQGQLFPTKLHTHSLPDVTERTRKQQEKQNALIPGSLGFPEFLVPGKTRKGEEIPEDTFSLI